MIHFAAMTDEELLTMYYNEDEEDLADLAFMELDRRYRSRMLMSVTLEGYNPKFVKLYNKPGLEHKADELINEALLKVADSKGRPSARWDPARQPRVSPWLFGILHNVVISFLRKKRPELITDADVQTQEEGTTTPSPLDSVAGQVASPEEALQHQALLKVLRECLEELPEQQRQVCEMLFEQGLKQNEIAARLKVSAPTLTRLKQRACELLRECLRRKGVGDAILG